MAIHGQGRSQQLSVGGGVEGGVSALDLYNTPHNFARAKITIKKPLKY